MSTSWLVVAVTSWWFVAEAEAEAKMRNPVSIAVCVGTRLDATMNVEPFQDSMKPGIVV